MSSTICKDYLNLELDFSTKSKTIFNFKLPQSAFSSMQFGSTIRIKLIQANIRYEDFKNPVSIYIQGISTGNYWTSNSTNGGSVFLTQLNNHMQNNQHDMHLNTLIGESPEYTINTLPEDINIILYEEYRDEEEVFKNVYKSGSIVLELSYHNGIIDFQPAFSHRINSKL
jgi:hypothetical protein